MRRRDRRGRGDRAASGRECVMRDNDVYEKLFALADGTIADSEAGRSGVDVEQAATLVLTEVADRAQIGVGGYQASDTGGASLPMRKYFFHRGLVHGLDVFDKSDLDEARLTTVVGDQSDRDGMTGLCRKTG